MPTIVKMECLKRVLPKEVITFSKEKVLIYDLTKNATFKRMFQDLGEERRRWKDKEEVLRFAQEHPDKLGNLFELEDSRVALVRNDDNGRPYVRNVFAFSRSGVWRALYGYRIVSLQ